MPVLPYATEGGPNTFERTRPHRKSIQRKRSSSRASRRAWCGCCVHREDAYAKYFIGQSYLAPLVSGRESQRFQRHIRGGLPQQLAYPSQGLSRFSSPWAGAATTKKWGKEPVEAQPRRRGVRGAGDQALAWGRAGFDFAHIAIMKRGGRRLERVAGAGRGRIRRVALNRRPVARARQNTTADTMVSEAARTACLRARSRPRSRACCSCGR